MSGNLIQGGKMVHKEDIGAMISDRFDLSITE